MESQSEVKVYRFEEVKEHKDVKSAWIVIHNKVYDVTKFLEEVGSSFTFRQYQICLKLIRLCSANCCCNFFFKSKIS